MALLPWGPHVEIPFAVWLDRTAVLLRPDEQFSVQGFAGRCGSGTAVPFRASLPLVPGRVLRLLRVVQANLPTMGLQRRLAVLHPYQA